MAEAQWTDWSVFDQLTIKFDNPAQPDSVTEEEWQDTWFFALGTTFKATDELTLRAGIAYDQSPVEGQVPHAAHPRRGPLLAVARRRLAAALLARSRRSFTYIDVEDTDVDLAASDTGNAVPRQPRRRLRQLHHPAGPERADAVLTGRRRPGQRGGAILADRRPRTPPWSGQLARLPIAAGNGESSRAVDCRSSLSGRVAGGGRIRARTSSEPRLGEAEPTVARLVVGSSGLRRRQRPSRRQSRDLGPIARRQAASRSALPTAYCSPRPVPLPPVPSPRPRFGPQLGSQTGHPESFNCFMACIEPVEPPPVSGRRRGASSHCQHPRLPHVQERQVSVTRCRAAPDRAAGRRVAIEADRRERGQGEAQTRAGSVGRRRPSVGCRARSPLARGGLGRFDRAIASRHAYRASAGSPCAACSVGELLQHRGSQDVPRQSALPVELGHGLGRRTPAAWREIETRKDARPHSTSRSPRSCGSGFRSRPRPRPLG